MDLIKRFGYDKDGEAVMYVEPRRVRSSGQYRLAIPVNDAWRLTEPRVMFQVVTRMHELFNMGLVTAARAAQVAFFLQDGIDKLFDMPPRKAETRVSGEGVVMINGNKHKSFDVTDNIEGSLDGY